HLYNRQSKLATKTNTETTKENRAKSIRSKGSDQIDLETYVLLRKLRLFSGDYLGFPKNPLFQNVKRPNCFTSS
ncbi:hypothetical protein LINPERPRIM_LOCUS30512, partial [Linum perenne]